MLNGAAMKVGSTGAGGDQQIFTQALNVLFNTKMKLVAGYPGTQELMLAIERGELDGIVGYSWSVARSGNKEQLDNGALKIILQVALNKHPELPNVPLVTDFVKNPTTGRCSISSSRAIPWAGRCWRRRGSIPL